MATPPPSSQADPLAGLSRAYRERHGLVALARRGRELRVAMTNPHDPDVLETLRLATGCRIDAVGQDRIDATVTSRSPSLAEQIRSRGATLPRFAKPTPATIMAVIAGAGVIGLVAVALTRLGTEAAPHLREVSTLALPPAFAQAGFAATVTRLSQLPPAATPLAAVGGDDWGRGSVELLTADPDRLRAEIARRGNAGGFSEAGQQAEAGAGFRVTYRMRAALPLGAVPGRMPPLYSANHAAAVVAIDSRGAALAQVAGATWKMRAPSGTNRDLLQVSFVASGPQAAILGVADSLESGPSRLGHWRLTPDGGGVRLEAVLLVRWSASPSAAASLPVLPPHAGLASLPPLFAGTSAASGPHPQLLGIAGRLPDDAEALVRTGPGKSQSLRLGATVMGWTLVAIAADRATFEQAGERYEAVLKTP